MVTARGCTAGEGPCAQACRCPVVLGTPTRVWVHRRVPAGAQRPCAHALSGLALPLLLQARLGITVCATLQRLPPDTSKWFAALLVLQQGRPVYFGPGGQPCEFYFSAFQARLVLACSVWLSPSPSRSPPLQHALQAHVFRQCTPVEPYARAASCALQACTGSTPAQLLPASFRQVPTCP